MKFFKEWKSDLPSGMVVFLVALPLCLGVGLASTNVEGVNGLPNLFSGIIAGIIGGIVVGSFSGSRLGVSGPAAGLITIILAAITTLGSFEAFLVAVVLSGIIQIIAGFLKAGLIGSYFPSSVIKGMLAAIGLTLILKEIPHAMGYDKDFFGDEAFFQWDGHNTFTELLYAAQALNLTAISISIVSLAILIILEKPYFKKMVFFKYIPGALIVVLFGIGINTFLQSNYPGLSINGNHLVDLPVASSLTEFTTFLTFPDFSALKDPNVYVIAMTIALVGSLETLLSVEATDKLDPERRYTPTNKELKAQGLGNLFSGLLGGLPVTQVIVRSSANINSGAKSRLSAVTHGILLLSCVLFIPEYLNLIPYASLAAILLMIGYKLSRIDLYKQMYRLGLDQFIPFISTILGVLFTDLLKGIGIGMAVSVFFILQRNYRNNYKTKVVEEDERQVINIQLSEEVTFLNKASLLELFASLKQNDSVVINALQCRAIDHDALEVIKEFKEFGAQQKNINLKIMGLPQLQTK